MRRLIPALLCFAFAATLQASVPAVRPSQSTSTRLLQHAGGATALPLTGAPADRRSFIAEFYSAQAVAAKPARKSGLLKRFSTLVKKTAQKVNFFD